MKGWILRMKKILFIGIAMSVLFVFLASCSGKQDTSMSADFSSIMQALSENYEVKAVNNYSTDAIPNVDGYEFKVEGKSFKVLKMQESDFNNIDPDNKEGDFLQNIELVKNSSKPYVAFIEKGGNLEILDNFKNINIE